MSITVYGYSTDPGIGTVTGFGSSIESVVEELRDVRTEIAFEDGYDAPDVRSVCVRSLQARSRPTPS